MIVPKFTSKNRRVLICFKKYFVTANQQQVTHFSNPKTITINGLLFFMTTLRFHRATGRAGHLHTRTSLGTARVITPRWLTLRAPTPTDAQQVPPNLKTKYLHITDTYRCTYRDTLAILSISHTHTHTHTNTIAGPTANSFNQPRREATGGTSSIAALQTKITCN